LHETPRVVIIGAGFGGLSLAALLAKDGYAVQVLEKNDDVGGRAMVYSDQGHTFDMGPSWYLMPDVFETFFQRLGVDSDSLFSLVRLDPSYRIFFGPGDYLDISADLEANIDLFERVEAGAGEQLRSYLSKAAYEYDVAVNEFLYRNYLTVFDFFNKRTMTEGRKLHVFENLARYTKRYFASERLRKVLSYSMVFLGGSPSNTPALYSILSHVDFNLGVWYPMGGMGVVVQALRKIAEDNGAQVLTGQEVTAISVQGGKAVGVYAGEEFFPADVVVANADYPHVELSLLPRHSRSYSERYWRTRTLAPSAFMLYLGFNRRLPGLEHHSLSFEYDWEEHFNSIFAKPNWPSRPSYYLACPSKTDPSVAPPGGETVVMLVPVASGLEDSDEVRERFTEQMLDYLEHLVGEELRSSITVCTPFSQRDFRATFNAYQGTALGLSHTLMQTAVFRPRHRSRRVSNLFYSGQYTHPGIGMPMTLIASTLVHEVICKESACGCEKS